ncbi:hypothetical protein FACS1894211_10300 [Clostridia bacterium]|nr:hypothetical protein FACS1894211_10300 [Clostridia bacterium]
MQNREMHTRARSKAVAFWAISGAALIAFGLLIILTYGANVIAPPKSGPNLLWLIGLLGFFGIILLARGIINRSAGHFWLSWIFVWCAAVVAVGVYTDWGFRQIYPAFILAPAAASALTWLFFPAKAAHLKTIIFFSAISLILFLNSIDAVGVKWPWIVGILVIAVGAMFFINAFTTRRGRWDDADRAPHAAPLAEPRGIPQEPKPKKRKWDEGDVPPSKRQ